MPLAMQAQLRCASSQSPHSACSAWSKRRSGTAITPAAALRVSSTAPRASSRLTRRLEVPQSRAISVGGLTAAAAATGLRDRRAASEQLSLDRRHHAAAHLHLAHGADGARAQPHQRRPAQLVALLGLPA